MEIIIFFVPLITALVLLLKFRKETMWWEYAVLILPSLIIGSLLEISFKSVKGGDIEYLGNYVTKATYYEEWDEMVWVTKTRRVYAGVDSKGRPKYRTETYRTRERKYHPECWTYVNSTSSTQHNINKETFDLIVKQLKSQAKFVDMHRDYHKIDGDAYEYYFDGKPENSYTLSEQERYLNPVKASRSIFRFEDISPKKAKELGLYDYADIINLDQNPILGHRFPKAQEQKVRWLNGYYGPKKKFRCYLLFFKDKPESIAEKQRSYWEGGNKNELVCCIGIDKRNKIQWTKSFSWEDTPNLAIKSQNWLLTHPTDLSKFSEYISPLIEKEWKRKEFKDFNYLTIELSDVEYFFILLIVLIYNIGISCWIIENEYTNEENKKQKPRVRNYYNRKYYR